jgi:hypothetical protein
MFTQTQFKSKCLRDFEDEIRVVSAVKTDDEISIKYHFAGKEKRLVLKRDKETAEFLKRHSIIHTWRPQDGLIRMFSKSFINLYHKKGFVHEEREVPYKWDDIDATTIVSAQNLAACNEFDQVSIIDKVYSMFYYYLPIGTLNRLALIG